jgi:hypothetical protein
MGTLNFQAAKSLIDTLQLGNITADEFISEFLDDNTTSLVALKSALLAFHADENAYEVNTVELMPNVEYNRATHTGKVTFKYTVNFHFGCADIDRNELARETAAFAIDPENRILTIHIHDKIQRDTVDEF